MSFCFFDNVVLENHSVQNSPWREWGLLAAHGLIVYGSQCEDTPSQCEDAQKWTLHLIGRRRINGKVSVKIIIMVFTLCNSYTMDCPPVRGDNQRALANGLSYV